jgi:DNA ligase (NAD+)
VKAEGVNFQNSRINQLNWLKEQGFEVVEGYEVTADTIEEKVAYFAEQISKNDFPSDGLVLVYDDIAYGQSLGMTSKFPRDSFAFKWADEIRETRLLEIEWSASRTGLLNPVAIFEPVELEGTTVSRASVHNISIMEELSGGFERIGDTLHIFKANQIIPQISKWEHNDEYSEETHLNIPEECPICGGKTEIRKEIDTKVLVCSNSNCEGKLINKLEHFCGKKGLDIKGLSKATLEKLIDWGWVNEFKDLFTLKEHRAEWLKRPGFGVKSVDNILNAIENGKNCELSNFIASLGIPLIGSTASKDLAKRFGSWNNFIEAVESNYHFWDIPNFGWEMHSAIVNYDYSKAKELYDNYLIINKVEVNESQNNLEGLVFVITGKVNKYKNRDELKAFIESQGGKVAGSISSKTNYLINNDVNSNSSKNVSAKKLGVPIVSEEDFLKILEKNI